MGPPRRDARRPRSDPGRSWPRGCPDRDGRRATTSPAPRTSGRGPRPRGPESRVGDRVGLEEAEGVAALDPVELRLACAEPRGLLDASRPDGEADQPLEGLDVSGGQCDELGEGPTLPLGVAVAGGEPGPEGEDLGRRDAVGRQVAKGSKDRGDVLRGHRQDQPGPPDCGVARPPPPAVFQPPGGLVVAAGPHEQVGLAQPDPVVIRRRSRRRLQRCALILQGEWVHRVEPPVLLEGPDPVGVDVPALLDQAAGFFIAPLELVEADQRLAGLDPVGPAGPQRRRQELLGHGESVALERRAGPHEGGMRPE